MVNSLCGLVGRDPIYANVEPTHTGTVQRTDEFYGKPLAAAVRVILERREAGGLGAASVEALYADMIKGGYEFDAKNDSTAKRSLAITLAKNTYTFHRLPNGDFGLLSWYPNIPGRNRAGNKAKPAKADAAKEEQNGLAEPYVNEFAADAEAAAVPPPEEKEKKPSRKARKQAGEPAPATAEQQ